MENNYKFADLFAGAGGFTVGFKQAGYDAIKAVEFDPSIANTYEMNNPSTTMIVDDIKNVDKTNEFEFNELLTYAEQAMIDTYKPKFNHISARPTKKI